MKNLFKPCNNLIKQFQKQVVPFLELSFNSTPQFSNTVSKNYDCIFHIGAPKTGSSALQAFLIQNRKLLAEVGFYYPEHSLDINGVSGGHSLLGKKLADKDIDGAKHCLANWLKKAREDNQCLLISAESLYSRPVQLKELTKGLRVLVIAYFRDPIESLISHYNQLVKRHFGKLTLQEYIRKRLGEHIPSISGEIFFDWIEIFGKKNVLVFPYDRNFFHKGKIELSFLCALGIPIKYYSFFRFQDKQINASYSPGALELKRLFNHILDDHDIQVCNRIDWCLQKYSDNSSEYRPGIKELLGEELYSCLVSKFINSHQRIKIEILNIIPVDFLEYPTFFSEEITTISSLLLPLQQVLAEAFTGNLDLVEYLRKQMMEKLKTKQLFRYEIFKLAELLKIQFKQYDFSLPVFHQHQIITLVAKQSEPADLLREVALMLERCGQSDQALSLITRALELRPHGPAIIKCFERLSAKNLSNSKTVDALF